MLFAFIITYHDCPGDEHSVEKVITIDLPHIDAAREIEHELTRILSEAHDGDDCYRDVDLVETIDHVATVDQLITKVKELCEDEGEDD